MFKQILGKIPRKPTPSSSGAASASLLPGSATSPLPAFTSVPAADRPALFLLKLALCSTPADPDLHRQALLDLVDYLSSPASKLSDPELKAASLMVAANLFRALPSCAAPPDPAADDDAPASDPNWPHLQVVHEFLLRLVSSSDTDARLAKRYIDQTFLLHLLDLFDSEDQRERDYLKTTLHRLYGKFMVHRPFIRKAINNIFFRFIFETQRHNGIAELLEILGSIINGFALPLKDEHRMFLTRALLPLHKPKCVPLYHQQLSYCVTQFVEKDFKLADTVIRGLLKYWPLADSSKEVMFIGEMEEVLEVTQEAEFQRCMVPLFRQIGRCLNSSHFQVAERALFLWNNNHVQNLITQNRKVILPIIFPALERSTRGHWNQAVQSLTLTVRKLFLDADQELFEECLIRFHEEEMKVKEVQEKRELTWKQLEGIAASKAIGNEALLLAHAASSLSMASSSPRAAAVGT